VFVTVFPVFPVFPFFPFFRFCVKKSEYTMQSCGVMEHVRSFGITHKYVPDTVRLVQTPSIDF
jgi:hypothetical protein